jgi:hypothetical protein
MRGNVLTLVILGLMSGLSFAADAEKTTSVELEDLTWLIGEWEGEYNLPEGFPELGPAGAQVVSTNSFRRTLGREFISLKIRDRIDGKLRSTGEEIIGHDNTAGKLGHWFFGSRGFHGNGLWSRTGDVWSIKWQSFEPDGKKIEGVSDHVRIDADAFTWQMRDIKENGKDVRDWPKVTYRRKAAAAQDENDLWTAYRSAAAGNWNGTGSVRSAHWLLAEHDNDLHARADSGRARPEKSAGSLLTTSAGISRCPPTQVLSSKCLTDNSLRR